MLNKSAKMANDADNPALGTLVIVKTTMVEMLKTKKFTNL
jgi:hypothetical protein